MDDIASESRLKKDISLDDEFYSLKSLKKVKQETSFNFDITDEIK
jgi:hypothetical protein